MTRSTAKRRVKMVFRQLYYEQLSFWRNPMSAIFTVAFSLIFLVLLAATGGAQEASFLHVKLIQYYVPGFAAYGVMSACFNSLAITLVNRRENGRLKRLRLSPLPAWVMTASVILNAFVVSAIQVVLVLLVGRYAYGARLPTEWGALVIAVAVGVVCFAALGIATSTLVPNEDAAGPIVSIVFFVMLFLSGMWFPLHPGSALYEFSKFFPVGRLIDAMFAPFHLAPGASPWAWNDIGVVALWGLGATVVAVRRFRFEPRRH